MKEVNIIGAGLAGCEAAYFLGNNNIKVNLFEVKRIERNEIQKTDDLAELVCSNTLRSKSKLNAAGILKAEMQSLDSLVIKAAIVNSIPSDDALAVDRLGFSAYITNVIENHPNINLINKEITKIDPSKITIIATGPLTTNKLSLEISKLIARDKMFFLDASAPIITKDSIDYSQVFFANRHNKDNKDQICIPLNETQFNGFVDEILKAEKVELKDIDKAVYFKGCQPIEQIAKTSKKLLLKGPMSPNNIVDDQGNTPYAVVQLRADDALKNLYNFIGFQTSLKWKEQKRVLSTLPGMKNINIVRYGVIHKNYYVNSARILNEKLQVKKIKNVFMCGQITGVEGYIESASSGILAGISVLAYLKNLNFTPPSRKSMIGALNHYITNPKHKQLKPMKCNLGILDQQNKNTQDEFYSYNESAKSIETFKKINYKVFE